MIDLQQLKIHVVRPALEHIELWTEEVERLILLTGFVESRYKYVAQIQGPARSFWQIEPVTMYDIYKNFLEYRPPLKAKVDQVAPGALGMNLTCNMAFGVIMARLQYRRHKLPIPALDDLEAQAHIWKQAYNTPEGKGTEEKFIKLANEIKEQL